MPDTQAQAASAHLPILSEDIRGTLVDVIESSLSIGQAADVVVEKLGGRASLKQVVRVALGLLRDAAEREAE